MKIAITGGTAGIGQALGNEYESRGHEVLRLSRRNGHNIRVIPKLADVIESCDVFVNNAQVGFAQTELLLEMARRWKDTEKTIIVVSTMMTSYPMTTISNETNYYVQKVTLEEAVKQLRQERSGINYVLLKPGYVATNLTDGVKAHGNPANVDEWAKTAVDILEMAGPNLVVTELSLGPSRI
jgi:NADP-dependent 3-hydroxy acid dehydrogenase YdfG